MGCRRQLLEYSTCGQFQLVEKNGMQYFVRYLTSREKIKRKGLEYLPFCGDLVTTALQIQLYFVLPVLNNKKTPFEKTPLLLNERGNKMTGREIKDLVTATFVYALGKPCVPQNLRTFMTTHLSEVQVSLNTPEYRKMMGHSSATAHEVFRLLLLFFLAL